MGTLESLPQGSVAERQSMVSSWELIPRAGLVQPEGTPGNNRNAGAGGARSQGDSLKLL